MIRVFCVVLVLFCVFVVKVNCATETILPVKGRCFANDTHWGDDFGIEKLPPCWSAVCRVDNNPQTILLATPCSDGFDMEYGQNDQRRLLLDHCYPSNRGELPAPRCCGGYPICAHNGENSDIFNVINFFTFRNQIIYQPWFVKYEDVKLAADGRPPVN